LTHAHIEATERLTLGGLPVTIAVAGSIGSILVEPGADSDLALRRAVAAMYLAEHSAGPKCEKTNLPPKFR
jgi:hypothetical protein